MTNGLGQAELIAVLAAVTGEEPRVMTVAAGQALPSGPFISGHRSLQSGLRAWIEQQTGHPVGFLEQLYTFADSDREAAATPGSGDETSLRRISISYLGLVHEQAAPGAEQPEWHGWYEYFPWEDHRAGPPACLGPVLARLALWAAAGAGAEARGQRIDYAFGQHGAHWNEDLALQRYELLYEAGLVAEAGCSDLPESGRPMRADHRRILATGIARLRARIKYSPAAFELMPDRFSLLQLQRKVEALVGLRLHKSNFRRQIDQQELIEETGEMSSDGPGRPAMLYRYRATVVQARALAGTRLPISRN
ncbi:NUDIX hydrolase [Pseudogemmobacter faecipullorum]|uniref:NUDIX hydrolase n=1 Tax=Pseudogemmobacter faecipullorum TaxID=2755041 RepID=UPI001D02C663